MILPKSHALQTTRLSSKGQVILPKPVRDSLHWGPGTEFVVEEVDGGVLLRPIQAFRRTRLEEVSGCLRYSGKPKTLADMKQAVVREVRKRHAGGRY